jgi:Flp pilus assembly protein TadD
VRLAPDSPQAHFHLARAYQRAGRKEDADKARLAFMRLDRRRSGTAPPTGESRHPETE